MPKPKILRIRFIPKETNDISNDKILYRDEKLLVTEWEPIHPRKDISHGKSYTYLQEGYKLSRFIGKNGETVCWYCDIIDASYSKDKDEYKLVDLLLDIKVYPDNSVEVLDMDELAEALENNLITKEMACLSLKRCNSLLQLIQNGHFPLKESLKY